MQILLALALLQTADALTEKLQQPFLKKAAWGTDYDKARAGGRLIFAYFTLTGD